MRLHTKALAGYVLISHHLQLQVSCVTTWMCCRPYWTCTPCKLGHTKEVVHDGCLLTDRLCG